jgi:hypothetical protein
VLQSFVIAGLGVVIAALGAMAVGGATGPEAIHCSLSTEPLDDAAVQGLGLLFGILIVARVYRARMNAARDRRDSEPTGRLPYRDLGMRESLASFSDDAR